MSRIGSSVLSKGSGSNLSKEDLEKKLEKQRKKITKTVYNKYKDKFEGLAPGIKVSLHDNRINVDIPYDEGESGRYTRNYDLKFTYGQLNSEWDSGSGPRGWKWIFVKRSHPHEHRAGRSQIKESKKVRTTKSNDIDKIIIKTEAMFKLVQEEMEMVKRIKKQVKEGSVILENKFPEITKITKKSPREIKGTIGETNVTINKHGEEFNLSINLSNLKEDEVKDFLKLIALVG